MLHIVNKSPFQSNALQSCLRMAQDGHALLLIEDAVYAATTGAETADRMRDACTRLKIYALQPDLDARGVTTRLLDGITLVDYGGFVELTVEHTASNSWL